MNININFGGFYHSHHENVVERAVAMELGAIDDQGDIDHDAIYDFNEWQRVFNNYSVNWLDMLNADLGTSFTFKELNSPKEYNFSTNVIIADMEGADVLIIKEYIARNHLQTTLLENLKKATTPRDGYHPYYSMEDLKIPKNEHMLMQIFIDVIIEDLGHNYPYICDDFGC